MYEENDNEIELMELIQILWKKKWLILASTIIFTIAGFMYTNQFVTPIYESKTTLMVNGANGSDLSDIAASFDLSSITASQKLVVTYSEIVRSRIVLEQVIERLNLDTNYQKLVLKVTAKPVSNTEILNITVSDEKPEHAAEIANTIADVFVKEVIRIMKVNNVEIIDKAIPIDVDVNVHLLLNTAIGMILGLMFGVAGAIVFKLFDRSLKTADDISKYLDLPVIGSIVNFNEEERTRR